MALQAKPDVGVDVGKGVDLRVAEQVLDRHQVHALFQQQRGADVSQVVEADIADVNGRAIAAMNQTPLISDNPALNRRCGVLFAILRNKIPY